MKTYMKPTMESEAFVANEFVSTCYTVTCDNCGAVQAGYDKLVGQITSIEYRGQESNIIRGTLGGEPACINETTVQEYKPWWYDLLGDITHYIYERYFKDYYMEQVVIGSFHPVVVTEGFEKPGIYHPDQMFFHPNASV